MIINKIGIKLPWIEIVLMGNQRDIWELCDW